MPIDKTNFPAIRGDVNIEHHPDLVAERWKALDDEGTPGRHALMAGINATRLLYEGTAKTLDVRRELQQHVEGKPLFKGNQRVLRHGFEAEYAQGVERVKASVLKSFDAYHKEIAGTCDLTRERVAARMKDAKTPPDLQREIRAHVKSLPEKDRLNFVSRDVQIYHAVNSAPAYLSGMTADAMEMATTLAEQRFAGPEVAQFNAVHELNAHLLKVRDTFIAWADAEMAEANSLSAKAVARVKGLGR